MKKFKILTTIFATSTPLLCLPIPLTSCNKDKKGIDIKTNNNIKIECSSVTVGQNMVITYKLDDNYGFDLANSTITFKDSNSMVTLLECDINRDAKTITVPGKFVTSKNVTINIKAENSASTQVTIEEYSQAWEKIANYNISRNFQISGPAISKEFTPAGEEKECYTGTMNYDCNEFKDHLWQSVDGFGTVEEYWGVPDTPVGCWQIVKTLETTEPSKAPSTISFGSWYMTEMLNFAFPYTVLEYDPLFNAYYGEHEPEANEYWSVALKFNTNKQLTYIGYAFIEDNTMYQENIHAAACSLNVNYTIPYITVPEGKVIEKLIYSKDEFTVAGNQLECPLRENEIFGKMSIPWKKDTLTFDKNKNLIIKLDKDVSVSEFLPVVAVDKQKVSPENIIYDHDKHQLTIKATALSSATDNSVVTAVLVPPGPVAVGHKAAPTKFIICQNNN